MKMLTKKVKKGFTIVELVIVIAVIAILAAVLIPTFSNVISAANESVYMQECRAEWSNYLPEVASDSDFGSTTYYVTYDANAKSDTTGTDYTTDYYFVVENGTFYADDMKTVTTTDTYDIAYTYEVNTIDTSLNYTYLNGCIRIYNITAANAGAAAKTAADDTTESSKLNATDGTVYTSGYDVYASVTYVSNNITYNFAISYVSSAWTVNSVVSSIPSTATEVEDSANTASATGYSVTFYAVAQSQS